MSFASGEAVCESQPATASLPYSQAQPKMLGVIPHTLCARAALPHLITASIFSIHPLYCSKGDPMIVYQELSTLCRELGFPPQTLYGLSNNLPRHYRTVRLPKRDGTFRTLSVPDEILKRVQRAIADKLLAYEPVSPHATAYRPASNVCRNARPHVGAPRLLKLDIARFFDSIPYAAMKDTAFPREKYAEPLRILLAMLCYHGDVLPQGAPSSPAITNILMRDFDERVGAWCRVRHIAYTRYCDDMTFSGDFDPREVTDFVQQQLRAMNLFLNPRKAALIPRGKQQCVTGVVVNDKLSVPAEYRRKLRSEVYYCRKFGVEAHLRRTGSPLPPDRYLTSLLGRISYVLQVCPDDGAFLEYRETVRTMLRQFR